MWKTILLYGECEVLLGTQEGMKKELGRPTKYYPEIVNEVQKYLETLNDIELPSIEGLALYLKINPDTVYEWVKKYPDFSENIKSISVKQKLKLMNDGMYGGKEVNSSMAIFLLKAIHGMKDGTGTTNVQVNVTPILGGRTLEVETKNE